MDHRDHLVATRFLMMVTGTWRVKLTGSPMKQTLYNIYSVIVQSYMNIFVLSLVIELPIVWSQKKTEKVIENIEVTILCVIILIKTYICQRKKVTEIVEFIEETQKGVSGYDEEGIEVYNNYSKYTKYLGIFLFIYSSMCGITLVSTKFLLSLQWKEDFNNKLANNETITDFDRPLPYVIWRPVDDKKHYISAFTLDVMSVSVGCTYNSITQIIFLSILTFVTSQLIVIQISFRNFGHNDNHTEKELYASMRDLILHHKKIIMYVENLDASMRNLVLLEFTINSLQITAIMLQLLGSGADINLVFRLTYITLMILQVFLLAWHANEIKEQSYGISHAVYESAWYNQSERIKRCLHIVMMRAQRPLSLSVGPFFTLSNDTAVTSMKAAYSYLTILRRRIR